jgi:hypothetical protein
MVIKMAKLTLTGKRYPLIRILELIQSQGYHEIYYRFEEEDDILNFKV